MIWINLYQPTMNIVYTTVVESTTCIFTTPAPSILIHPSSSYIILLFLNAIDSYSSQRVTNNFPLILPYFPPFSYLSSPTPSSFLSLLYPVHSRFRTCLPAQTRWFTHQSTLVSSERIWAKKTLSSVSNISLYQFTAIVIFIPSQFSHMCQHDLHGFRYNFLMLSYICCMCVGVCHRNVKICKVCIWNV